jgi:ribosome-associated translation inhibitor RaiA
MRDGARGGLNTLVSSFMKEKVETIPPEASLLQAAAAMLEKQVPALIVVDGQRPVGIITAKDIFESALYREDERNMLVSGLSGLDKEASDAVVSDGRKMLGKIGNSLPIEALAFHVKKTGKEYFVSGHIRGPIAQLRASASDYDLMGAVAMVLDELRTQALKHKHTGIERRKNKRLG